MLAASVVVLLALLSIADLLVGRRPFFGWAFWVLIDSAVHGLVALLVTCHPVPPLGQARIDIHVEVPPVDGHSASDKLVDERLVPQAAERGGAGAAAPGQGVPVGCSRTSYYPLG